MAKDWHQQLLSELIKAPLVETRLGPSFTSIGHLLKFDLTANFPATMAKKLFFNQVARELYCFLKGYTSKEKLHEHGVHIWDADMAKRNLEDIGPIYGYLWRYWGEDKSQHIWGMDQMRYAIGDLMRSKGTSRRAIVTAWDPIKVLSPKAALPPCHVLFQFNIVAGTLYTDVYQRSADAFLGLPFDVTSFAIMSRLVYNELSLDPNLGLRREQLNYHVANMHLYQEHLEAAVQEINNVPTFDGRPNILCNDTVDTFHYNNCTLLEYYETRVIKAKLLT